MIFINYNYNYNNNNYYNYTSNITVIIPAGGSGTRLHPHTHTKPKSMMNVAGKPIIGHILDRLIPVLDKVDKVCIVTGFKRHILANYITKYYERWLDKIVFVNQDFQLGLGHSILQCKDVVSDSETLLITLGDMIFGDMRSYDYFIQKHNELGDISGSFGAKEVTNIHKYGIIELDNNGIVRSLVEKPENYHCKKGLAISGVYFVNKKAIPLLFSSLSSIKLGKGNEYQLTDAFKLMVEKGAVFKVFEVDEWQDCGNRETMLKANRYLLERGDSSSNNATNSSIIPPTILGEGVTTTNSVIGPYVSIDSNTIIHNSILVNCIVGSNSSIRNCCLKNSLIGDNVYLEGKLHSLDVGDKSTIFI